VPPRPAPALRGGRDLMCSQACLLGLTFVREKPKVLVSEEEMAKRKAAWKAPPLKATKGTLYKYIKVVESASEGCVTDA
jgi:dihydroxy-acid dehydratase